MTRPQAVILLTITLLAPLALAQATYTTGFDSADFVAGDVKDQNGWGHLSNSSTKGIIEAAPAGPPMFGDQSLAIRTRNVDFFGVNNHLFSPLIDPAAGETGSTAGGVVVADPRSHFSASFWLHTPAAPVISTRGDGRFAELNPSSKLAGANEPANRYAQVRISNSPNTLSGVARVQIGWFQSSGFTLATVADLAWNTWYRFDYAIELVDGTAGAEPNDRFTLTIFDLAGNQVGTACGSTWELGWKSGTFGGGSTPRAINGFDFWSVSGPNDNLAGHLDNMTMTAFDAVPLAVSANGTTEVCAGGTTTLSAATSGSFAITSYTWRDASNAIVGTGPTLNAGAGTYTVTVTDTLCVSATSAPVTVTEFAALDVSIAGTATVPMGGTTTLSTNVTGGSGTIGSYVWRNALSQIVATTPTYDAPAGTYTVIITDASCGSATSDPFVVSAAVVPGVPSMTTIGLMTVILGLIAAAVLRLR